MEDSWLDSYWEDRLGGGGYDEPERDWDDRDDREDWEDEDDDDGERDRDIILERQELEDYEGLSGPFEDMDCGDW